MRQVGKLSHLDDHAYSEQSVPTILETCFRVCGGVTVYEMSPSIPGLIYQFLSLAQAVNGVFQDEELVAAVLGHIDSLRGLLRCSAVNKCWHFASKTLQPTSIKIPGESSRNEYVDCDDIPQWLQQKHKQQVFDKLQNLSLTLFQQAILVEDVRSLTESGLAILMLAGLWPLKACRIEGPFDVCQIAGLLPQTLHHLHVDFDLYHRDFDKIDNCFFQRFRSLRSLHLTAEEGQGASFQMHPSMALPNLRHLHLSPWPFQDNGMLADSLPQLTHAALHVHALELEQYVKLPHIDYLSLQLVSSGNEAVQMKVISNLLASIYDCPNQ